MTRHILNILAILTLTYAGACSDNDVITDIDPGMVTMKLNVSLPSDHVAALTRADEVSDITYFEVPVRDYEKISSLRIIIVDADGKVEHNRRIDYTQPVSVGSAVFLVKKLEKKQIYLFGNELPDISKWEGNGYYDFSSLKKGMTFPADEIGSLTIKADDSTSVLFDNTGEDKLPIPVNEHFEVTLTSEKPGTPEEPSESFDLFMTRASVKFSVNATYENVDNLPSESYTISAINFSSIASQEYLLPNATTYSPSKYESSTLPLNGRFITDYTVPATGTSNNVMTLPVNLIFSPSNADAQTKSYYPELYFPETRLQSGEKYKVQLVMKDDGGGTWLTSWENLPNLEQLPRNTHVIMNLTLRPESVSCVVQVVPYIEIDLQPEYGWFPELENKSPIVTWPTNTFNNNDDEPGVTTP